MPRIDGSKEKWQDSIEPKLCCKLQCYGEKSRPKQTPDNLQKSQQQRTTMDQQFISYTTPHSTHTGTYQQDEFFNRPWQCRPESESTPFASGPSNSHVPAAATKLRVSGMSLPGSHLFQHGDIGDDTVQSTVESESAGFGSRSIFEATDELRQSVGTRARLGLRTAEIVVPIPPSSDPLVLAIRSE